MRTSVLPSRMAFSKSSLMPMERMFMAYDESEYIREIEDFIAFKAQEEGK